MRLIDADAFDKCLEQAEIEATKRQKYVFSSAINTIRGNLANFPPINQWIPCSERLPDVGQKVLASTNKTCFTQVFKGTSGASNSSWWWEKKTIKHIVAWMPLPEPWGGDSDD